MKELGSWFDGSLATSDICARSEVGLKSKWVNTALAQGGTSGLSLADISQPFRHLIGWHGYLGSISPNYLNEPHDNHAQQKRSISVQVQSLTWCPQF